MSRSRRKPRNHRKVIKNKYMQGLLMIYGDDFGGTRGKDKSLSRLVRAREKQNTRKEVNKWNN